MLRLAKRIDAFGQAFHTKCANVGLRGSVVVDEDEGRLCRDSITRPDGAGLINDVGECSHLIGGDELVDRRKIITARDADEVDVSSKALLYLCDRRGFSATRSSPGRPEPKDGLGSLKSAQVDLAAICSCERGVGSVTRHGVRLARCHSTGRTRTAC